MPNTITLSLDEYERLLDELHTFRSMFSLYYSTWCGDRYGLMISAGNRYQKNLLKKIFEEEIDDDEQFEKIMETYTPKTSWENSIYMYFRDADTTGSDTSE